MNRYVYNVFTCSESCPILFLCYSIKIFLIDFQSLTYFLVKKLEIYLYNQKKGLPLYQQNETITKINIMKTHTTQPIESLLGVIIIIICILLTCYIEQL